MRPQVLAHGFGIRYDLPVPLYLYLLAAGTVVILSFALVGYFVRGREGEDVPAIQPVGGAAGLFLSGRWPTRVLAAIGLLFLVGIIFFGAVGAPEATYNPAEYLLWIYFWAAALVLCGVVGDFYAAASPFSTLDRLTRHRPARLAYPSWLGRWPAVVAYLLFSIFELASGQAAHPHALAAVAVGYTVYTLAGMRAFGREAWNENAEFFAVLFRLVGAMGFLYRAPGGQVAKRRPAVGLATLAVEGWDVVAFVVLALSSLAFDGVSATPAWNSLYIAVLPAFDPLGALGPAAIKTLGLVGLAVLFGAVYLVFITAVQRFGGPQRPALRRTAALFAYTLVPIALVYNAAHNYSYIVIQGQGIVPLLADPLHRGAHLLPTAGYRPSFALADAAFVWLLQVALIVLGHVVAVYLAHVRALRLFRNHRSALRSQYPMLVLMVIYTTASLVILGQRTVEAG